jgi:hypothetical protein
MCPNTSVGRMAVELISSTEGRVRVQRSSLARTPSLCRPPRHQCHAVISPGTWGRSEYRRERGHNLGGSGGQRIFQTDRQRRRLRGALCSPHQLESMPRGEIRNRHLRGDKTHVSFNVRGNMQSAVHTPQVLTALEIARNIDALPRARTTAEHTAGCPTRSLIRTGAAAQRFLLSRGFWVGHAPGATHLPLQTTDGGWHMHIHGFSGGWWSNPSVHRNPQGFPLPSQTGMP